MFYKLYEKGEYNMSGDGKSYRPEGTYRPSQSTRRDSQSKPHETPADRLRHYMPFSNLRFSPQSGSDPARRAAMGADLPRSHTTGPDPRTPTDHYPPQPSSNTSRPFLQGLLPRSGSALGNRSSTPHQSHDVSVSNPL